MVGLERSMLPLVGERDFDLAERDPQLRHRRDRQGSLEPGGRRARRPGRAQAPVVIGLLALPVSLMIALAPSWGWIVAANLFLGANQGLAWSMTVVMKIDLVGPRAEVSHLASTSRRGTSVLPSRPSSLARSPLRAPHSWVLGGVIAVFGTVISILFVRDTAAHVEREQRARRPHDANASLGLRARDAPSPDPGAARRRGSSTT